MKADAGTKPRNAEYALTSARTAQSKLSRIRLRRLSLPAATDAEPALPSARKTRLRRCISLMPRFWRRFAQLWRRIQKTRFWLFSATGAVTRAQTWLARAGLSILRA